MKAIDWIARTAMLVLACLATLALIGSLASVSDSALGDAFPGVVARPDVPDVGPGAVDPAQAASVQSDVPSADAAAEMRRVERVPPPAPHPNDIARWLKALTYAVIALAAFAAAGVVALVRIAGRLDRATLR